MNSANQQVMSLNTGATSTATADNYHMINKFDGDNFNLWKFRMKMILEEKDLWQYVEEKKKPSNTEIGYEILIQEWDRKSRRAMITICLNLTDAQLVNVQSASSAKEAWDTLVQLYETKDLSNRLFLRRKFFTVQMANHEHMITYINRVKVMADKLAAIGASVEEEDIVMTLLSGLPENYNNLIVALEVKIDDLTLDSVTARLLHEEARRMEGSGLTEENAFYSNRKGKFVKHGYNKSNNNSNNNSSSKSKSGCHYCGKQGHWIKKCRKRIADEQKGSHQANSVETEENYLFMSALSASLKSDEWYVDSGASNHLTGRREYFTTFEPMEPRKVYLGDSTFHEAVGKGSIDITIKKGCNITLNEVLYVPNMTKNLLSVASITKNGFKLEFGRNDCVVTTQSGKAIARAVKENNLYRLDTNGKLYANIAVTRKDDVELWHQRLGHIGINNINKLVNNNMVTGLPISQHKDLPFCDACVQGKLCRLSFPKAASSRESDLLGLIHTDVCGPMKSCSFSGARYFLTFTDDMSRMTMVYFLKQKNEVFDKFINYKMLVEKQTGKVIKKVRSDNGGEAHVVENMEPPEFENPGRPTSCSVSSNLLSYEPHN